MSGLGGRLWEVVAYGRWSLRGSFTNSNLTDGGTNQGGRLREVVAQGVPDCI